MVYRQIDTLILSCDSEFTERIQSLFERVGQSYDVRESHNIADIISDGRPRVVVLDMREDKGETQRMFCLNFQGRRVYHCLCICKSGDECVPKLKGENHTILEDDFTTDKFFMNYYFAALRLNEKLDEIMYKTVSNEQVKNTVSDTLYKFGIMGNRRGFEYIKSAIFMVVYEPKLGNFMTKDLYIRLGKQFGVTGGAIERGIRLMVKGLYNSGAMSELNRLPYFSNIKSYPKNSELIPALAKIVCRELDLINERQKIIMNENELDEHLRIKAFEEEKLCMLR